RQGAVDLARPVGPNQHVEKDETRWRLARQLSNSAFRGMKPHLKSVERQTAGNLDDQLAVDDEAFGAQIADERYDLRKVPTQGLARFCPQLNGVAGLESKAPKAVPFRFELPSISGRQFIRGARFHWRRVERQIEGGAGRFSRVRESSISLARERFA